MNSGDYVGKFISEFLSKHLRYKPKWKEMETFQKLFVAGWNDM